jgi:hypothetical protein
MHVHRLYIILLSGLALIGCRSDNYVGKIVPQKNRIALKQGGPHPGVWSGNHMKFRYSYFKTPSQIEFSGSLSLVDIPASANKARIGLWVHFLDSEGRIIRDRTVYSSNMFWEGKKIIQKNLNPPAGTKGMAFSYEASVGSGLGDGALKFQMIPYQEN